MMLRTGTDYSDCNRKLTGLQCLGEGKPGKLLNGGGRVPRKGVER